MGMTLPELMIAIAISSAVSFAVMSLQIFSGKAIKEIQGQTRTRASRMRAIDQIRFRLFNARIGSCEITQDGHRLEFNDPNKGATTSAFFFAGETLFYDEDVADGAAALSLVRGPIDITFELESGGALVKLKVKTSSTMKYADVDIQDGETVVYLRNT
jgi:prepilin-type N-terminal cleavage/methylation domain-containing protein